MDARELLSAVEAFLADAPAAAVVEEGEVLFDFATGAHYSLVDDHGKTLLQLWSPERNMVRRVLGCEKQKDALRFEVQRFGQPRPSKLEFIRSRDRRSPTQRRAARGAYQRLLGRVLQRHFPDWKVGRLTSAADLERSFGPVHCRGTLARGRSMFAILGVNSQESQSSVDASLTFALLWLDLCRERNPEKVVEGLMLFAPAGTTEVLRARLACLDHAIAKFRLFELEELSEEILESDCADRGNIATRLVQCADELAARERFSTEIARIVTLVPECDVAIAGSSMVSFRLYGLEFARARLSAADDFRCRPEITFGAGPCETRLDHDTEPLFTELLDRLMASRRRGGDLRNALYRLQPERWLESLVVRNVAALDDRLGSAPVYSQVPAFSASDRAMIDVLTATHDARLAVIELKASEDIHLPLQGLDYWARVRWHQQRGEFQKFGYFTHWPPERATADGKPGWMPSPPFHISAEPPLLFLVAPALHVHPSTDTLLRYLSPAIDCTVLGIDERWREGVRVIFRKRPARQTMAAAPHLS